MSQERPDPPYPTDTRAKGWRFELDYEQIEQSDTWDLAGPEGRPWLLMMWLCSWRQVPCGSLPGDEAVIAAKLAMPPKAWAKHRASMLRGWWAASDGRLYHATVTARVLTMLDKRANDAQRAANRRARRSESGAGQTGLTPESRVTTGGLTPESRVTPGGVHSEFDTKHQAPSTSNSQKDKPSGKGAKRAAPAGAACPDDVAESVWRDWMQLRKAKRAPVSDTVVAEARSESVKAGMTLEAFLRVWCVRGSQGLQAEWLRPNERATVVPINRQEAQEQRNDAAVRAWLASGEA